MALPFLYREEYGTITKIRRCYCENTGVSLLITHPSL